MIYKRAWNAHVYYVWQARNMQIHQQLAPSMDRNLALIRNAINYRLLGAKKRGNTAEQSRILLNWDLPHLVCV